MITSFTRIALTWAFVWFYPVFLLAQPSIDEIYYPRCEYNGISCDFFLEKINRLTCDTTRLMKLIYPVVVFAPDGKLYNINFIEQERIDVYEIDLETETTQYRFSNYSSLTPALGAEMLITNDWKCYMLANSSQKLIQFEWPSGTMELVPDVSPPNLGFLCISMSQDDPNALYGNVYNQGLRRFDLTTRTFGPVLVPDVFFFDSRGLELLIWLPDSCGSSTLYGTSRVNNSPLVNNTDTLISYTHLTFQTQPVCPTDYQINGLFSPYSNQPFNCTFFLDLDTTASGQGYTDTLCLGEASSLSGPGGCELVAESGRIDSAAVWLVAGPGWLSAGLAGSLPAPLLLQSMPSRWTLLGLSDGSSYAAGLDALRFTASAAGSYTLAVAAFDRAYGRTDTVLVQWYFGEPLAYAGEDSALVLCSSLAGPQALLPLLGPQAQAGGSWDPALDTGTDLFSPGIDSPGLYRYTVLGQYGCPNDTARVEISLSDLPEPFSLGADTLLCGGQTLLLSLPTGNWTSTWGDGHPSAARLIDAPGLYVATLSDPLGCTRMARISVTVAPADTVRLTAAVCEGLPYAWEGQNLIMPGRYCLNFNSNITGCDSVRCLELSWLSLPEIELATDAYFCPGQTTLLTASAPGASLEWSTSESGSSILVGVAGLYSVTATSAAGCTTSAQVEVSEAALERAFETMSPDCAGLANGLIVPALPLPPNWSPYSWTLNNESVDWSMGAINLPAGQYLSAIVDSRGCTFRDTIQLDAPTNWALVLTPDQTILAGDTLGLSVQAVPPVSLRYDWTPAAQLNCDTCASVLAWPSLSLTYYVQATDEAGCEQGGQIVVRVLPRPHNYYAPTAFSPNDDGVNDRWQLYGEPGEYVLSSLQIYQRWGGLVYETTNVDPTQSGWGWNGRAKGQACEPGVYLYRATLLFRDGEVLEVSGEIHLVR